MRVREFELAEEFELLVDPGVPLGPTISALTGLRDSELRGQPHPGIAVRRFLEFAGDAVLVAHNARFDLGFLDCETERLTGARLAGPVVDTVGLARRLLAGRTRRAGLGSLSNSSGPRRALSPRTSGRAGDGGDPPSADRARAGTRRAHGRGSRRPRRAARTEGVREAAARLRRSDVAGRLSLPRPSRPGALRGPRARLARAVAFVLPVRSATTRRRGGAVALERIEWRPTGSEVEAALEELRLLRELRPVANARNTRPDRYVYLRRRGDNLVCTQTPTPLGPIRSRPARELACRALDGASEQELAATRARAAAVTRAPASTSRSAAATRMRPGCATGSERSSSSSAPFVASISCATRAAASLPPRPSPVSCGRSSSPVDASLPFARSRAATEHGSRSTQDSLRRNCATPEHLAAEDVDALLAIGTFLRRPPPELRVAPLEARRDSQTGGGSSTGSGRGASSTGSALVRLDPALP